MKLVTWNIQCGKGCGRRGRSARIVSVAKALGDADVFCFPGSLPTILWALMAALTRARQSRHCCPAIGRSVNPPVEDGRQPRSAASLRQHDAVALAGAASRQSSFAPAAQRGGAQHAAPCAGDDGSHCMRAAAHHPHPPGVSSAEQRDAQIAGCLTCSTRPRASRRWRRPSPRALRQSDHGVVRHSVRRFQFRHQTMRSTPCCTVIRCGGELSRCLADRAARSRARADMRHS